MSPRCPGCGHVPHRPNFLCNCAACDQEPVNGAVDVLANDEHANANGQPMQTEGSAEDVAARRCRQVAEARARGYLIEPEPDPVRLEQYRREARRHGELMLVLSFDGSSARLEWNGDEIDDRRHYEQVLPPERRYYPPLGSLEDEQHNRAFMARLEPYLYCGDDYPNGEAVLGGGTLYGSISGIKPLAGVAAAGEVLKWAAEFLPPPLEQQVFRKRVEDDDNDDEVVYDATIRCCNCARRHRSYAAFAHCYWRDHAWIEGNGPYGTVSYCGSYGVRRGESSTTIMLWGTEAAARSAFEHLTHCGSRCTGDHDLVRLVLPSPEARES